MQYMPGTQIKFSFVVPDGNGDNTTGLTFSLTSYSKDGTRVTAGAEYTSIVFAEDASGEFYTCTFTPGNAAAPLHAIFAKSNAAVPDTFQLNLEPDWARIVLLAEKQEHILGSPEQIKYYMPDGTTLIRTFNMSQTGAVETREGV